MWRTYGVRVRLDSDRLVVDETLALAAVDVAQVHWVAGELDAAGLFAFAEIGIVVA